MMVIAALAAVALAGDALARTSEHAPDEQAGVSRHEEAVQAAVAVDEVAEIISDNYFDADRAAEIAEGLRVFMAGRDGGDADPFALAAAMTSYLAPLDGHFRVEWVEDASASRTSEAVVAAPPRVSFAAQLARQGYGFVKVERLPGNVGLIEMSNFAHIDFSDPADPARAAADGALALVSNADAVIIDLRRNGGGAPSMAGYLVSAFVAPGADVYSTFRTRTGSFSERPEESYRAPMTDKPIYLLLSRRSGSAAEALPYTLQAAGRATVVGETSAGAANPGFEFETPSGFTVFVATGAPINPFTGTNWEGSGVQPDIQTPAADALDTAYRHALASRPQSRPDVAWALEALDAGEAPVDFSRLAGRYGAWSVEQRGEELVVERGRRGVERLRPLSPTLFFVEGLPSLRYRFNVVGERAESVDRLSAYGGVSRMVRDDE